MKEKVLEISSEFMQPEWQTNKVKIRKWNLGIRNEILDTVTEFNATQGKQISTKLQGGYSQILIVLKCITEAPWKVGDIQAIRDLEPELGDWLYGEISEFNSGVSKHPQDLAESLKEKPNQQ